MHCSKFIGLNLYDIYLMVWIRTLAVAVCNPLPVCSCCLFSVYSSLFVMDMIHWNFYFLILRKGIIIGKPNCFRFPLIKQHWQEIYWLIFSQAMTKSLKRPRRRNYLFIVIYSRPRKLFNECVFCLQPTMIFLAKGSERFVCYFWAVHVIYSCSHMLWDTVERQFQVTH